MAIANRVAFQSGVPLQTIISMPLIMFGALTFTAHKTSTGFNAAGIFLALASNVILAVRNITMKKIQSDPNAKSLAVLKRWSHVALVVVVQGLFVAGLYHLEVREVVPSRSSKMVAFALASGMFHVAYTYISIGVVLQVMNVISHSITNIFKRLLVVLLLSALGARHVTASNFLGLGLAVVGLVIHTLGKLRAEDTSFEGQRRTTYLSLVFLTLVMLTATSSSFTPPWRKVSKTSAFYRLDPEVYLEMHGLQEVRAVQTDFSHIMEAETDPEMREFLSWRLVDHPEDTDKRSRTLTTNSEIVEEAKRVLVNLMQDLIGTARHVMLIDIPTFENKGDPAIAAGEVLLMGRLGKTIVYYCETSCCRNQTSLNKAIQVSKRYAKDDLVILLHGGGNIVGYPHSDNIRANYMKTFRNRKLIMLSQSIWLHGNYSAALDYARRLYSNRSNLIMLIRDRQSLAIAKKNFKGISLILAPDFAFCIGMTPRQMPPLFDIIWLKRIDLESANYSLPAMPGDISIDVDDWYSWKSNKGHTDMQTAFIVTGEGFQFLQRGRIVITDRLHGHILCLLMEIPHVIIDNPPYLKLSSFVNTWTTGVTKKVLVNNGSLALEAAIGMLQKYQSVLPSIGARDMTALN
ncbi:hypothetical protein BsWGS_03894 [Bradybaena similaris]